MPLLRTLDFTRRLPEGCTFSRAGSRTALRDGLLVDIPPDVPAFESTNSKDLGLSIQQASSNIAIGITPEIALLTVTPTFNSLTGVNDADVIAEVADLANFQRVIRVLPNLTAGQRFCFSLYAAPDDGAEESIFGLVLTNKYNNGGVTATFRNDGIEGVSIIKDDSLYYDSTMGFERANDDWVRYWVSGTKQVDGRGSMQIRTLDWTLASPNTSPNVNHKLKIFGAQIELGKDRPSSYMSSGSVVDDVLQLNDITGLNAAQGTIIIEHDVRDGDLLSSSGTPIISATIPGKTALAWSGTDSSISRNGGDIEVGGQVSITSTVDILPNTTGHIKSIRIYDERLSDEQLRLLTSKEPTAKSGVYRIASLNNKLPVALYDVNDGFRHYSRFPFKTTHDCSSIRLVFNNWKATTAGDDLGSEVTVHRCALEYGGSFVPVTFNGQEGIVLPPGASDVKSDDIGELPAGTEGFIRVQMSGDILPGCRGRFETGAWAYNYNPVDTTVPDVYGTGDIRPAPGGSASQFFPTGYCPIMIGIPSDPLYDPEAIFVLGDSLVSGTNDLIFTGTYMNKAAVATNTPLLMHGVGGEHHYHREASELWRPSLAYCRLLFDNMYANNGRGIYAAVHGLYNDARGRGVENIYRIETFPSGSSNDNWATDQFNITPRPNDADINAFEWVASGYIDGIVPVTGIVDPITGGWVMNGTEFYMTVDGTHQTPVSDNIVALNAQALLENITLSQPIVANTLDGLTPESPVVRSQQQNSDGIIIGIQFSCVYDVNLNK